MEKTASAASAVIVAGGSPCQDLSILMKNGEGLLGSRSELFFEAARVQDDIRTVFLGVPVVDILENVGSMADHWVGMMSRVMQRHPVRCALLPSAG